MIGTKEKLLSVSLTESTWREVVNIISDRHTELTAKASKTTGIYESLLILEASNCLNIVRDIELELAFCTPEE